MTVRSLVLLLLAWSLMALCGPGLSMAATATSTEMVGHTYDVPAVHHDSAVMTASRARSGRENGHHNVYGVIPHFRMGGFEVCAWPALRDAAKGGVGRTTAHGAERVAGAGATRGGVLGAGRIGEVRSAGRLMKQTDGASVRILENGAGRFDVVVDGQRGLITTFENLSQRSLNRLAGNYGWK